MKSSEEILREFVANAREDSRVAELAALVPTDRALTPWDLVSLVPLVMQHTGTADDVVRILDALAHAYVRATGLHFVEV